MQSIQKIQKAIYTIIDAQSTGELANINGVFHYVPQETNFPYVHIGDGMAEDISNFKNTFLKIDIKVYVYNRSESNSIVMSLCEEIKNLLINISNLSVEEYTLLDCKFKGCSINLDKDGITWKGEMIFEFITKKDN